MDVLLNPGPIQDWMLSVQKAKLVQAIWNMELCYLRCGLVFDKSDEGYSWTGSDGYAGIVDFEGQRAWCQPACWLR